jgi:hypothetical protein
VITQAPVHGHYFSNLLVSFIPMSIGTGLALVSLIVLATTGVDNADAGLASGLVNSAQQVGGSLGLAILATLSVDYANEIMNTGIHRIPASVSGYHVAS